MMESEETGKISDLCLIGYTINLIAFFLSNPELFRLRHNSIIKSTKQLKVDGGWKFLITYMENCIEKFIISALKVAFKNKIRD